MNEICLSCRKHTKCGRAEHETIGCGYYVPLTEQEWLQTANTEQLAERITDIVYECRDSDDCMDCRLGWCSKDCVVEWLKQPHKRSDAE